MHPGSYSKAIASKQHNRNHYMYQEKSRKNHIIMYVRYRSYHIKFSNKLKKAIVLIYRVRSFWSNIHGNILFSSYHCT